ncbi:hypothetical protein AtNW77_Chr5g0134171 [Arabidopsis thaliana]|uniref:Uncharacterized protein n=2 Tax=Arabidopsis TaxID=3701 RepID=Q9FGY6_ARATH|nr:uncharacterized protein AT5G49590 [Arabidopsis thaliana]AED95833.1 hypothetical protein AT5G49590 [Arabidopsis thaliana]KAG7605499.1 hypothetical protein ISN45_At05g045020 [Arabidopsis thaliana x Arabidopsis arenosa]BAB10773.1 unnamed protein product [Arabidopsis thaliana]|eukprot:NP_199770.1 hypothetical protein AT5G49590 [Arabidopsis thaliana]
MESTMSAQVTSLLVANFSGMCTSNGQSTKTRNKLWILERYRQVFRLRMVLYIINWRDINFGSCQSQKKSISFTCRGGSSPLGDEVYDWCRQPRCRFFYRLFRSGGDGVFPNRMVGFLIVFGGVTERQG